MWEDHSVCAFSVPPVSKGTMDTSALRPNAHPGQSGQFPCLPLCEAEIGRVTVLYEKLTASLLHLQSG